MKILYFQKENNKIVKEVKKVILVGSFFLILQMLIYLTIFEIFIAQRDGSRRRE